MTANSAIGAMRSPLHLTSSFRQLSADLALLTTVLSVVGLFAISPVTLEHFGISYLTPGGGVLSKLHPSTLLAAAALTLRCLSTRRPLKTGWDLLACDAGVIALMIAILIAAFDAALFVKSPVTPLVETFILPIAIFVLLRDLDPAILRLLALILVAFFCLNALIALFEYLARYRLVQLPVAEGVSSDPTRADVVFDWRAQMMQDWRASALLGHPLANGMIVSEFILCLIVRGSRWLTPWIKGPVLLLQFASLFAFGARVSLVLTFVFAGALLIQKCADAVQNGARLKPRHVAMALLTFAFTVGAALLLYETGFFDRVIERFASDSGSAQTRATMFEMLQPIGWTELMLGPNQDVVGTWQRLYGLEFGIESSWLGLILTYGLIVTVLLMAGLALFSWSIIRASGRGAGLILISFFITVSGTASLSGKTTALAMTIILVLLFLRKDERVMPLLSVLSVKTV